MTVRETKRQIIDAVEKHLAHFIHCIMDTFIIGDNECYEYAISEDKRHCFLLMFLNDDDADFYLYTIDHELLHTTKVEHDQAAWFEDVHVRGFNERLFIDTQVAVTSGGPFVVEVFRDKCNYDDIPHLWSLWDVIEMAKLTFGKRKLHHLLNSLY